MIFILLQIISIFAYDTPGQYYIFQQEWPGSVCDQQACNYIGKYDGVSWNIHGLWPQAYYKNQCQDLSFCSKQNYVGHYDKQTDTELDQGWVGLYNPSQPFRAHEWSKHGTCWDENDDLIPQEKGMSDQEEYFDTALQLWKTYNLTAILNGAGITQSDTNMYWTDNIFKAIQAKTGGKKPVLLCTKDSQKTLILVSVSICMDESYKPVECYCSVYGGIPCGSNRNEKVLYPKFQA